MALSTPYTYFQCPCASDAPVSGGGVTDDDDDEEKDFDPRAPRSCYSLYQLDQLLYCEDCQQIRCPKCVLEETLTWYCPNCLFEVPSSSVKSEGTRCTRSCFECPCCTAPLSVTAVESPTPSLLSPDSSAAGPFVLSCPYCTWNSMEIGIKFDKTSNVYGQLAKVRNGGGRIAAPRTDLNDSRHGNVGTLRSGEEEEDDVVARSADDLVPEVRFANLRSFYQGQLADSSPGGSLNLGGDFGFGSPSSLSRIMGLYTTGGLAASKAKTKPVPVREASNVSEGLAILSSDSEDVLKLGSQGWDSTASRAQRERQAAHTRFSSDLRPTAYLLRTKRSKRCKTCRHILTKPDPKVSNTRFRIRLVALNYIPKMEIKSFPYAPDAITPTLPSRSSLAVSAKGLLPIRLVPQNPTQFILTLTNPLFDSVRITLATPSHTPGRVSSKITILCPQFEIGANTDVWDEALAEADSKRSSRDTKNQVAEAGKIWDRGRNWSSVVVEVIPGRVSGPVEDFNGVKGQRSMNGDNVELAEDEDILEIPIFVRIEWETDDPGDEDGGVEGKPEKEAAIKRELAYWCVLGVGQIAEA